MNSIGHQKSLIASEAVIPIRSTPSESAEMVSQLLFGECCELLNIEGNWSYIQAINDSYQGWVDSKMLLPISEEAIQQITAFHFVLEGGILLEDKSLLRLARGTAIPQFQDQKNGTLKIGSYQWIWDENIQTTTHLDRSRLIEVAQGFLNTPYLWGGCSGFGIDCSGLTQRVFRMCGLQLPRDSSQQAKEGTAIRFGEHREGDLAFFAKPKQERITHVGLIVDPVTIIHASGKVRIDTFTNEGIWNEKVKTFTHQLITIQRC
ncbi:MAG: C40 family peptidase [Bacteroidota bacterium]